MCVTTTTTGVPRPQNRIYYTNNIMPTGLKRSSSSQYFGGDPNTRASPQAFVKVHLSTQTERFSFAASLLVV